MKTLISEFGGALTLTEQGEVVTLSWDESVGGGAAAGIIQGKGSLVLNGPLAIALGTKLINAHLPAAMVPLATVVEGVAAQAIAAMA